MVRPQGSLLEPALRLALTPLPAAERQRLITGALAAKATSASALDRPAPHVFAALEGERLVGAVWTEPQLGRATTLSPPQLVDREPDATGVALLEAVLDAAKSQGFALAQALLAVAAGHDFERFLAAGFDHACDLLYLVSQSKNFPTQCPNDELEFAPVRAFDDPELAAVVAATYEGTLDCPQLNDVRSAAEVLISYRTAGDFDPERWLLVRHAGQPVGCLLLADHPSANQWELVYMGVSPAARGRGWGQSIVRYAQWLARLAGRARLVLAVDAANGPAIAAYERAAFLAWDRRCVLLKVLTSE